MEHTEKEKKYLAKAKKNNTQEETTKTVSSNFPEREKAEANLKKKGYSTFLENGVLMVWLDEKGYYDKNKREEILTIMKDAEYNGSHGIRLKE